jgi:hypothetical protein
MAATLLIVLAIILGSLAIANRNSLGLLGSAYQNQSREARAAAEIGMAQVVSELNRNRNRQLLVNACRLTDSTPTQIAANLTLKVPDGSAVPDMTPTFSTAGTLPTLQTINIGDGSAQRWRLVNANCIDPDDVRLGTVANPVTGAAGQSPSTGDLVISVQGQAIRGGQVVATSTIQQTMEVVPKCLDRSLRGLGNAFGNDNRICQISSSFGFIAGAALQNTGTVTIKGGAYNLNVDPVTCIATSPSGCFDGLANTSMNVVNITLPPVLPTANTACKGVTTGNCNVNVSSDLTLSTRNIASWPAPWSSICTKQDASGNTTTSSTYASVACSINNLGTNNNRTLTFDVSGPTAGSPTIPIRLHYPNAGPAISLGNGSGIFQCNTQNGTVACNTTVSSTNPLRAADLALFGCPVGAPSPCGAQTVNFSTGNGNSQSLFTYFPNGSIDMGGNVEISGVVWTNRFTGNGNVTINIPDSDVASVCNLMSFCDPDNSLFESFAIDYVTRAVKRLSFY